MNTELFNRWLHDEAETLYHRDSTPEIFMDRAKTLIEAMVKMYKTEVFSMNDLEEILTARNSGQKSTPSNQDCYFDIVDLSLYRAN